MSIILVADAEILYRRIPCVEGLYQGVTVFFTGRMNNATGLPFQHWLRGTCRRSDALFFLLP